MTSVFPSTTAAAITSFLTGDAPQQHGVTGWHTYLRELGCVMTVLPGRPRYGGSSYRGAGLDPARLFDRTPVFDRMPVESYVVAPRDIVGSDYNLAHLGSAKAIPYASLRQLFGQTLRVLRRRRRPSVRRYLYVYWPRLDMLGHQQGMESPAARAQLALIEEALARFLRRAKGTDTLLLITADHGQIDTTPADVIDLADHPGLADCLTLPLCGEPRASFAYLRWGRGADFLGYCQERLAARLTLRDSQDLLAAGLFGEGEPHPRLHERIGDFTLLPQGTTVVREWLPFEGRYAQVGVHGGLTAAEMLVPLCTMRIR